MLFAAVRDRDDILWWMKDSQSNLDIMMNMCARRVQYWLAIVKMPNVNLKATT